MHLPTFRFIDRDWLANCAEVDEQKARHQKFLASQVGTRQPARPDESSSGSASIEPRHRHLSTSPAGRQLHNCVHPIRLRVVASTAALARSRLIGTMKRCGASSCRGQQRDVKSRHASLRRLRARTSEFLVLMHFLVLFVE